MKFLPWLSFLFLLSCATETRSTLFGAAVGGGTGAGVGQLASRNFRGTLGGLLIGAGLGGLVGFLAHSEKTPPESEAKPTEQASDDFPSLTKPRLKSMWVPDTIEGNKYIKGHFIYVIEDPGTWAK